MRSPVLAKISGWACDRGCAPGSGERRLVRWLDWTSTQNETPEARPLGLVNDRSSGSLVFPWIQLVVPADSNGWVKIGPAPASAMGRSRINSTNPGRLKGVVRGI